MLREAKYHCVVLTCFRLEMRWYNVLTRLINLSIWEQGLQIDSLLVGSL